MTQTSIRILMLAAGAMTLAWPLAPARAAEVIYPPRNAPDTVATPQLPVPPPAGLADSLAALRNASRGVDYLWVLRGALVEPASIDSVVARASRIGVRGLLVQVVGRGDAWYHSSLLPRAEALTHLSDPDPLAHVIARAHAAGLEVHAWVNCMLVWSGPRPPQDPRHVLRAHPDWIAEMRDGRRTSWVSARGLQRLKLEGAYLAAARPGVQEWVVSIAAEIAANYAVDGVHLDYIRQPDVEVGFDPDTRARFASVYGADPARIDRYDPARRAELTAEWQVFQRQQIAAIVRGVRDTLRSIRPHLLLSAAVVSDPSRSEGLTAQSWRAWVRDSLIDRAFVMCYSPDVQIVMNQLVRISQDLGASDRVVPGIAVYNTSPVTAAVKIKGARALGYPLLALYSYDSLFTLKRGWSRLERGLDESASVAGP
jgi:uncharacterized lipoprotein YddW (UPF0748 family)